MFSTNDLPSRLFMGTLDPDSFQRNDSGWRANYVDADPDTGVSLEYFMKEHRHAMTQRWRGREVITHCRADELYRHLLQAYAVFPESWDSKAKEEFEAAYNLKYLATGPGDPSFAYFPDGAFMAIINPVPIARLRNLIACRQAMESDTAIASFVSLKAVLGISMVGYLENYPEVPNNSTEHYFHEFSLTGIPPYREPKWERIDEGLEGVVARRYHYNIFVVCPFRELGRVLTHLYQHSLIGKANADDTSDCFSRPEFAAIVGHSPALTGLRNYRYLDSKKSRVVVYPVFTGRATMEELSKPDSLPAAEQAIEQAEAWSRKLKHQLTQEI
ncbi:MAG: hypothetical protein A2W42_06865 [Candidatus Muproteobacteria bacterium RIFCSPHIGHO2_01_60_12]|nr:MAG: hypothetical protein A2W42_06865 [Candidatus Muproteobacteria bacterium RIFCSPHIGHO2_01_60_12]